MIPDALTEHRPIALEAGRPPTSDDLERWLADDVAARPARLERFRDRLSREGVDAYFGVRRENTRYLSGFDLADGEEKVAGNSGWFFVSADEVLVLADSRYTVQAAEQCAGARVEQVYHDLPGRWQELLAGLRPISGDEICRVAVEAGFVSHSLWGRLAEAGSEIELVPADGWIEQLRSVKEPSELERVASACAVADAALTRLLPEIRPGVTEYELALRLEWEMRTNGAEALAFDVACLSGPRAALPHGAPGQREVVAGEVLLFDFGAQVCGYRSDMTRTLFVGQPEPLDLEIYDLVARAQAAAFGILAEAVGERRTLAARAVDDAARTVIREAGHGDHFGHGLGHGIGLATHEAPSMGQSVAPDVLLPSPTVFSVEPGVYLDHQTGVRIEDLVVFDPDAGRLARLTRFPREATVVG